MMKEIRYILMGIASIILVIVGFPVGDAGYLIPPMPATYIGFIGILVWLVMELITEVLRGLSPQLQTYVGHWSLNRKDVHKIPWLEVIEDEETGKIREERIGDLYIMFPGGIDKSSINPRSGPGNPIVIFPTKYNEGVGLCTTSKANLERYRPDQLKSYIQDYLWSEHPARMRKNPRIYYGTTSHLDFSDTLQNLEYERKYKQDNTEITWLKKKWEDAIDLKKRAKEADKEQIIIGTPIGKTRED